MTRAAAAWGSEHDGLTRRRAGRGSGVRQEAEAIEWVITNRSGEHAGPGPERAGDDRPFGGCGRTVDHLDRGVTSPHHGTETGPTETGSGTLDRQHRPTIAPVDGEAFAATAIESTEGVDPSIKSERQGHETEGLRDAEFGGDERRHGAGAPVNGVVAAQHQVIGMDPGGQRAGDDHRISVPGPIDPHGAVGTSGDCRAQHDVGRRGTEGQRDNLGLLPGRGYQGPFQRGFIGG